ncbi:MAG: serine hydrolase domain-containing protein [Pseudomonadota bacterium]
MSRFNAARLAAIDARMGEWVASGKYERLEWMIGDQSGVAHSGATAETSVYRIYSMTKPLVSLAALQLVEEGKLQLYHPVSLYLPEYKELLKRTEAGPRKVAGRMTVHHLITHTSGLTYGFMTDGGSARLNGLGVHGDPNRSLRDEAKVIAQIPLEFEPGEKWLYSVSTDVLAAVLEVIEEKTIQEIIAERITGPLGMGDTAYTADAARVPPIKGGVEGLLDAATVADTYPTDNPNFGRGGHGLFSTLADYGKVAHSLLNTARGGDGEHIISPSMLRWATTNHVACAMPIYLESDPRSINPPVTGNGFGLGFAVSLPGGTVPNAPGAFGWSGAAETWFTVDPDTNLFCVIMAQNFDWPGASYTLASMAHGALRG